MKKIFSQFNQISKNKNIYGLTDELKALYIYNHFVKNKTSTIVLTSSLYDASLFYNKIKSYTDSVLLFPDDEYVTKISVASSPELELTRINTLSKLNEKSIIVTNLTAFLKKVPNINEIKKMTLNLKKGDIVDRKELSTKIYELGFIKESLVSATGEFSLRGFIVDIYPLNEKYPVRIEFFDDKIESIKYFDPNTQLSMNKIDEISIMPLKDDISGNENIYNILDKPFLFRIDNNVIKTSNNILLEDRLNLKNLDLLKYEDIHISDYTNLNSFDSKEDFKFDSSYIKPFDNDLVLLDKFIKKHSKINFVSTINKNISYIEKRYSTVNIIHFPLNDSFSFNNNIYLSDKGVFNSKSSKKDEILVRKNTRISNHKLLNIGDYVIHYNYGIGKYLGIKTIKQSNVKKDFLLIKYKGTDKIYLPIDNINYLYKYTDKESTNVKLDKLSGDSFEKTKQAVKKEIMDLAHELLENTKKRENSIITPYITFSEEKVFSDQFEYKLTKDQIKSINEIDADLRSNIPMDRLLCGDVGFGKTEVAFRGMFKTVINGFQSLYLCPTTILSKQQYEVALKRFNSFNLNIRLLNRFTNPKEEKQIYSELKNGKVDILFATHKGFNKNIDFKNLGLVIIDEEQRFGVKHKERIKEFKINVNVLTLSATPIPRTLKMALGGLKKLSLIETPPVNRHPVQTYVIEENFPLIKDAIHKEKSRNGQVYILYNDVKKMDKLESKINKEIPNIKTGIAHGQMTKVNLENKISSFIDHKYDVLICSTIIETGIDISNVNTLIILNSENFGLSQLYQLRGRVGRGDKIAYAYLMFNKNKVLTETATKRLNAIKDFTSLGSGYKIALRDLSIRGAGDILGSRQAGFVNKVGLELYTKFIKEIFDKEEITYHEKSTKKYLNIENHISENYILDDDIKIEIHDIISNIRSLEDVDTAKEILNDRFGKIPNNINLYMYESLLNNIINDKIIRKIILNNNMLKIMLSKDYVDNINTEDLFVFLYKLSPNITVKNQLNNLYIILNKFEINNSNLIIFIQIVDYLNDQHKS